MKTNSVLVIRRTFWVTRTLLFPDDSYETAFLLWHYQTDRYFAVLRFIMCVKLALLNDRAAMH